jgi:hypothetical protein
MVERFTVLGGEIYGNGGEIYGVINRQWWRLIIDHHLNGWLNGILHN